MKKNDWLMILSAMFLVAVITVFSTIFIMNKYFVPTIKTVSIMEVLNPGEEDKSYSDFVSGAISQEEYTRAVENKMQKIQSALNYFTSNKDVLLVEESVVKTDKNNYISITEAVKQYAK